MSKTRSSPACPERWSSATTAPCFPPAYRHISTHTLVFKDVQIDNSGHLVQNTQTTSIDSNNPTVRLVNGQLRPC